MAKLTEDEYVALKAELMELKDILPSLSADMSQKASLAEVAFKKFYRTKQKAERLEYILAENDGRLKQIRTGHSGKRSTKKKPQKTFDLKAYTETLSPEAREAFIQQLLNL